jgi:hypothetical protein
MDNLWLQPWDGDMGARAKDRLETKLKKMVCAGEVTLEQARMDIKTDWQAAFRRYIEGK